MRLQRKVQIYNEGIESVVKKDYKEALVEYILNAFESDATEVEIVSDTNELGGVCEIKIIDNGTGINHSNLNQTFESFLTSNKMPLLKPINIGKNKGKGRYAFESFANSATWETVYKDGDKFFSHTIKISASQKDYVDMDEAPEDVTSTKQQTGTTVTLSGTTLSDEAMSMTQIEKPLLSAFAYYLYLKKANGYKITVDGKVLDYRKLIDESVSEDRVLTVNDETFSVYFVKWLENIKSRYFFYFLDDSSREKYNKHTKFNNNAIDFCHSVYIESSYFNDFVVLPKTALNEQLPLNEAESKNQHSETFKKLLKALNELVESKLKQYVKKDADRLVEQMESDGGFPKFGDDVFEQGRKNDFVNIVKEIYCLEPRVFKGLKREPQKSILGFLNLLLFSDERENIIRIIEEVTELTTEERAEFTDLLKYTKLSNILRTAKLISDRLQVIERLKALIYDNATFATERNHIQKAIQDNYWLFGEEFHLVTADKNFEKSLIEYLYLVDGVTDKALYSLSNQADKLKRPDIFICQQRIVDSLDGSQMEQNIIVELKSPQVVLSKKIHRQIEDYMDFIIKEPNFISPLRDWRFVAVCKTINDDIKRLYEAFEVHNKRFLTHKVGNYEIYSMTWDDVFTSYKLRYNHLLQKMDIDKQALIESLNIEEPSKETANKLRDQVLNSSN